MADEKEKGEAKPAVEEAAAEGGAKDKPRSDALLLIVIGVALILVSAAVTYFVVNLTIPKVLKSAPKSVSIGPEVVAIKDVIVNIADTKGTRLLKIVPHLVVSEKALADIIRKSEAMVRDRIGAVAGKMTIDDLEGINGRSMLKNNIITRLNDDFKDKMAGTITDIYFEEYLIQ